MEEFIKENKENLTILTSLLLFTVFTGILITATGKIFVVEVDGVSGSEQDSYGNYRENHIDGGKFKFYAE